MNQKNKQLVSLGMFCAIAYIVMLVGRVPVVMFLSYDPKDVIIVIAGFIYGPMAAFMVSTIVSVIEMISVSGTGPIGCIMNILSTCAFACTAAYIYKRKHTIVGAVIGLISGVVIMILVMILWNYAITPYYMLVPREVVVKLLIPVFLPFNIIKGSLNAAITLLLYKPLVSALRNADLIPKQSHDPRVYNRGIIITSIIIIVTCILIVLAMKGII